MRDRQFRNRDRSLSPRPILRKNNYPSRFSRDSERSNRDIVRKYRDYEGSRRSISPRRTDRNVRVSDYDVVRSYDGAGVGARRSISPRRNERSGHFDVRTVRRSEYDDHVGVGSGRPRRVYDGDEDLRYAGSRSQLSDRPKQIVDDGYTYKSDYYAPGSKNGGERDLRYSDEVLPVSRSKQVLPEYVNEGKNASDPFTWADNVSVGGTSKSSVGHFSSGGPRYLTSDTERQRYVQFHDELDKRDGTSKRRSDDFDLEDILKLDNKPERRMMERQIYTNGKDDHLYFPENRKVPKYSLSQPKDYSSLPPSTFKESPPSYFNSRGAHVPSQASQSKHVVTYEDEIFGEPYEKLQMSPRILGPRSVDLRSSSRSYHEPDEEKLGVSLYGTSEIDRLITKPRHLDDKYMDRIVTEDGVLDSTVEKLYKRKYVIDDQVWDPYPSTSLHERKRDLDSLGSGSEAYVGRRRMKSGERYTEVRSVPWPDEERSDVLRSRDYAVSYSRPQDILHTGWDSEEVGRPRHGNVGDGDSLFSPGAGMKISCDGYGARKIYNPLDDEMDYATNSKKPKVGKFGYDEASRIPHEMHNHQRSYRKSISRNSGSPHKPKARDVKSRLGPLPPKLHVSQRLETVKKPSIKNRLGPTPSKKSAVKVSGSGRTSISQDDSDTMEQIPRPDDHVIEHLSKPQPSEPSEKSAEFKQLVESAFFKFLKQIYETPMMRKQYTEQGKAGGMKCIVCGSDSKEFANTERLATHTCTSEKSGLRSQHLGLHKALCVVSGWKIAELPISAWQCEKNSNAQNTAVKEDIIIWPPVVIVHNSTIEKTNSDERIIVSPEELVLKLKGKGFANITKVCNGKPANQSVMVVKFNATLSGLQEAERLHNSYVEIKQRESEVQQTESELGESPGMNVSAAASKEKYLDGHLGLAEDLDKLDFATKRRCGLKSKIEILRIVGAPLDTNGKKGSC